MKKLILIVILLMCSGNISFSQFQQVNLMPIPADIKFSPEKFIFKKDFKIAITGNPNPRIYQASTRMLRRLDRRTGLFFSQDYIYPDSAILGNQMTINVQRPGNVVLNEDESYKLKITHAQIHLDAVTDIGALRGMETLLQLLSSDKDSYYFPAVEIYDFPRFPWRGLLIDVCRHFIPIEVIKRNIDGMAAVKMNVLHLHLTEDQGFRVESKKFPKLHELGSDGMYFTQDQIKELIQYAADRGIRVVPEFDIPGHATSWFVGYPEFASAPGPYKIERNYGVFDPAFNPTKDETYIFFDEFLTEMSQLFPDDYIHIGGDENNGKQWDSNPQIQQFKRQNNIKTNHELQSYLNKKILAILTKNNKKMIGWDEILQPDMPKNIVIQSWRGKESLIEAAQKGYQVMLSNGFYIDLVQNTSFHYLNDPIPTDLKLTAEQKKLILGGEATMWSEIVTYETIDSRIWPRTAAIAERLWSPGQINNVDDMYKRLEIISLQLEDLQLTHNKNCGMILRRLAGTEDIEPLVRILDLVGPVKEYRRHDFKKYTSFSPFSRLVDAAKPDPKAARDFNNLVDKYLIDSTNHHKYKAALSSELRQWRVIQTKIKRLQNYSYGLNEIDTLSENISKLAEIGLELLNGRNRKIDENWKKQSLKIIENSRKPQAEVEILIIPSIEKLLKSYKPNNSEGNKSLMHEGKNLKTKENLRDKRDRKKLKDLEKIK